MQIKAYHMKNGERSKKLRKLQDESNTGIEGCSRENNMYTDDIFAQISMPREQLQV